MLRNRLQDFYPAGGSSEEFKDQQKLEDFYLPFGSHLDPKNRWVILSRKIPWDKLEADYADQFSSTGMGAPAKSFRMALGSLIIKEKLQISDAETVEQIQETPYLQYFIGLEGYSDEPPFDSSMMVHFRKRCNGGLIEKGSRILFREFLDQDVKKPENPEATSEEEGGKKRREVDN